MKTRSTMKAVLSVLLAAALVVLGGCGSGNASSSESSTGKTYKIGICNYVDDASLNQICENIQSKLEQIGKEKNVTFNVQYDNCNADANVMQQIIANFINDKVDLMIGVATPVAMAMQGATQDNQIPVVFAAVSDPVSCGVVESMEKPGANVTGTSDMLNTKAILDLMCAVDPDLTKVGLLYDVGQDASTTAIQEAKEYLAAKNIEIVEQTGTNVSEVTLAAAALAEAGVQAVFTPSDNTIMQAELSIYETFRDAKVKHYAGADSFALNGAFCGYGVNYATLGQETGAMAADILLNGLNPKDVAVKTFDNGIATVNKEIAAALGLNMDDIKKAAQPYCNAFQTIKTAESFDQ